MSRRTSIGWTERETLMRRDLDTLHEELRASRAKVLEWTDRAVKERERNHAGRALVGWIRGMCSDERPYPEIDAKLLELDDLLYGEGS